MLYRLLLRLFTPRCFRDEYGSEMQPVFEKRLREASLPMKLWLWLEAITDIATAGFGAHFDLLRQDLKYAVRAARNAPGFTMVVIGVCALGVGSATAVFSLADHILLRPLPFREPSRLVKLWEDQTALGYARLDVSPANYRDWKRLSQSFEAMAAVHDTSLNMTGMGDPERLQGASFNYELFDILGVMPAIGRPFTARDDRPGAPGVMLLSDSYFHSRFGGDTSIIGRTVQLDSEPFTIIGVMPKSFYYPKREAKVWLPNRFREDDFLDRSNHWLNVVGRLKPGVPFSQAEAEMHVVAQQVQRENPQAREKSDVRLIAMQDEVPARSRNMLKILATAALFLVLIACANLANLILARSSTRQKELEVRAALGAGRERLIRQLLTESALLATIGGIAGVALAAASVPVLAKFVPTNLPVAAVPAIDWRVMLFALGVTAGTAILFSIAPALRFTRGTLGTRGTGGRSETTRRVLVVVQVAASLALVISTGLLVRALTQLQGRAPGFTVDGKLVFRTSLAFPKYLLTATREQYYRSVLDSIRELPGVKGATVVSFRPMYDFRGGIWPIRITGKGEEHPAASRFVVPGYFSVMGTTVLHGRDFLPTDQQNTQQVAVVSESFANKHWPGESAVGRTFENLISKVTYSIVGVVKDVRFRGMEQESEPQMYFASAQTGDRWFPWFAPKDFIVATAMEDPASLLPSIRAIVAKADPTQPVSDVQTFVELIENDTLARRVQLWVIGGFTLAAFILASVGIHGLLAFAVARRTQEIGLRRALGATTGQIASLVFGEAIVLAVAGCAIGLGLAYIAGKGMEALLIGISATDPITIAAAMVTGLLMTLLGAALPALRALRVDPSEALRAD